MKIFIKTTQAQDLFCDLNIKLPLNFLVCIWDNEYQQLTQFMIHLLSNSTCIFCNISAGTEPADVVYEDLQTIAFLDKKPLFPGHVLVVPKEHFNCLSDLPDSLVPLLFSNAKKICIAVEKAMGADGSFVAINNKISQSIPHLHIHIVPRKKKDGLRGFFWPRNHYKSDDEKNEILLKIKFALNYT
jgi:histidine triad (HIT) family protein